VPGWSRISEGSNPCNLARLPRAFPLLTRTTLGSPSISDIQRTRFDVSAKHESQNGLEAVRCTSAVTTSGTASGAPPKILCTQQLGYRAEFDAAAAQPREVQKVLLLVDAEFAKAALIVEATSVKFREAGCSEELTCCLSPRRMSSMLDSYLADRIRGGSTRSKPRPAGSNGSAR
jgi:hypothetical protein